MVFPVLHHDSHNVLLPHPHLDALLHGSHSLVANCLPSRSAEMLLSGVGFGFRLCCIHWSPWIPSNSGYPTFLWKYLALLLGQSDRFKQLGCKRKRWLMLTVGEVFIKKEAFLENSDHVAVSDWKNLVCARPTHTHTFSCLGVWSKQVGEERSARLDGRVGVWVVEMQNVAGEAVKNQRSGQFLIKVCDWIIAPDISMHGLIAVEARFYQVGEVTWVPCSCSNKSPAGLPPRICLHCQCKER